MVLTPTAKRVGVFPDFRLLSRKHVVQVDIDRPLYLDEAWVEPTAQISATAVRLNPGWA